MSPEELETLNRHLSKTISNRARSLRKFRGPHGRKIGQKSVGYREAVEKGWVKPRNKAEKRLSRKAAKKGTKKTAFSKMDRVDQIKAVREKLGWLKDPLNYRSGIRHAIATLGTADPYSMPYRLYDMMTDMYPSLSYVISKKPRKRYNSDYWVSLMVDIVDSSFSVDEMIDRMREVAEKEYEEQNREDEEDDIFLFGGRPK